MKLRNFLILSSLTALLLLPGCTGSNTADQVEVAAEASVSAPAAKNAVAFETDLEALRKLYPLADDLAVKEVRWRYHNDFVARAPAGSPDIPAQDADRVVEAVFLFEDDKVHDGLKNGRATSRAIPSWYPDALQPADSVDRDTALTRNVPGLPGLVFVYPEIDGYVSVTYSPRHKR